MSDKLIFNEDNLIGKGSLVVGRCYIRKDSKIVLYLGKDVLERYCFYPLASVLTTRAKGASSIYDKTLAHYDLQLTSVVGLIGSILASACDFSLIMITKTLPDLVCVLPYYSYELGIRDWLIKSKLANGACKVDLKILKEQENSVAAKSKSCSPYVSAKDLVPGELYYTGSCWRGVYLYLGRTSDKSFAWYFVGNESILMRNEFREYYSSIEYTKSNKKVKPLAFALKDPDAYVSREVKHLIKIGWKADLIGFKLW